MFLILTSCQEATSVRDGAEQRVVNGVSKIETTVNGQKGVLTVDTGSTSTCLGNYESQSAASLYACLNTSIKDIEKGWTSNTAAMVLRTYHAGDAWESRQHRI